ncbi:hypothetical protein Mycsm_06590 (plasmid) [Mycobacterium sp. JS623]|uniref:DUF5995 family protein n=1 Tax=Mycobacterium sp. JS623 TaxID=212767 RepID=UPI0002A55E83|nr:DUF5995 family protein [Mycobacterium sp. JS623]AGB26725.1 hypothetical protein Mycsm_06590 [Mycobacterium sp. JS623]
MNPDAVAEVISRLRAIDTEHQPSDGARVFNSVYLKVTEMMLDRLTTGGVFHDASFVIDLDVRFAGYWFDAYDAPGDKPRAWAPLFDARARTDLAPIQFALAGINAHIEHDLPLAVVDTCAARGCTPTTQGVQQDYDKINELLASIEAGIRRSFLTRVEQCVDDHLESVAHLISSWDIAKARDFAWINVATLWELRRMTPIFDSYAETLARTVGMGSRLLLTPLL